jgi:hypothetical protein
VLVVAVKIIPEHRVLYALDRQCNGWLDHAAHRDRRLLMAIEGQKWINGGELLHPNGPAGDSLRQGMPNQLEPVSGRCGNAVLGAHAHMLEPEGRLLPDVRSTWAD